MNKEIVIDGDVEEFIDTDIEKINETEDVLVSSCGREVLTTADLSDKDIALLEDSKVPEEHNPLQAELEPMPKMTPAEILDAINAAASNGLISSRQKAKLKNELGVKKSKSTPKKETKSSKVKRRKQSNASRRKNRK